MCSQRPAILHHRNWSLSWCLACPGWQGSYCAAIWLSRPWAASLHPSLALRLHFLLLWPNAWCSGAAGSQSSSLNLFVLRPLWSSTEKVRQAYGQCILVCYQRRLKPEVTWLSFPCLFCWAVAFRLPQVPTKISEEEQFIKFPWLGL